MTWYSRYSITSENYAGCTIRVISRGNGKRIEIEASAAKYFQGHNVFGSTNLFDLCLDLIDEVLRRLNISATAKERERWATGDVRLYCVDIAGSFQIPTDIDMDLLMRELTKCLTDRGIKCTYEGTGGGVYARKSSRRLPWKFYGKHIEVTRIHPMPANLPFRERMIRHARRLLRAEITLQTTELGDRKLHYLRDWRSVNIADLWWRELKKLKISGSILPSVSASQFAAMPPGTQKFYRLWELGDDPATHYSPKSYRRHCDVLRELGIDVGRPRPQGLFANIPLQTLFDATRRSKRPIFARNTALFHVPSKHLDLRP